MLVPVENQRPYMNRGEIQPIAPAGNAQNPYYQMNAAGEIGLNNGNNEYEELRI